MKKSGALVQSTDKLVTMANQIAKNLAFQTGDKVVGATADHIRRFWDPRMRAQIIDHVEKGAEGMLPDARDAVLRLAGKG
jgi:formate dehydrogenase subunit delta